jgi:hypothetical protein
MVKNKSLVSSSAANGTVGFSLACCGSSALPESRRR